jgi:hypothetical protein
MRSDDPRKRTVVALVPFSFIRTVTVGLGVAPSLLTLPV